MTSSEAIPHVLNNVVVVVAAAITTIVSSTHFLPRSHYELSCSKSQGHYHAELPFILESMRSKESF